jgi:hypothetical protein
LVAQCIGKCDLENYRARRLSYFGWSGEGMLRSAIGWRGPRMNGIGTCRGR